jgi:Domain of Unknown Function (DUF1080)
MPRLLKAVFGFSLVALTIGTLCPAQEPKLEEGYTSLFNGKDLTGWTYKIGKKAESLEGKTETPDGRFSVDNGVIIAHAKDKNDKGGIKDLYTAKDFDRNFILKLQFRAAAKADSGVYIRGNQLQVRFQPGDWNDLEILAHGNVLVTNVNGKALVSKDVFELAVQNGQPTATLNGKKIPVSAVQLTYGAAAECKCNGEVIEAAFQIPAKGGIGLQAESGKFEFRHIRIKELD